MAMLRSPGAKLDNISYKLLLLSFWFSHCMYIRICICICMGVYVYEISFLTPFFWKVMSKSLEGHDLYSKCPNMLVTKPKNVSREDFLTIYLKMVM